MIVSDTKVQRDPLYQGRVILEKCAVVTRLAPTFFRFGSFEIFKETDRLSGMTGPSVGLKAHMLPHMLTFVVKTYFPHISSSDEKELSPIEIRAFFEEVVQSTAKMVALWQCVGYVHGVMNTDNMSILGLTIDYGPFGFMEHYNPRLVSNHSDDQARYCYEN